MTTKHRPGRERMAIAREAGLSRFSFVSVVAGTLSAYGAFALLAAVVGGSLAAANVTTDFKTDDWASSGAVGGLLSALVLLVAYVFGGYVAGRMSRRSGILHGVAVFVLSLVAGAVVAAFVAISSDGDQLRQSLRSVGIPTSADQVTDVALVSVIVAVAAMLVGSVVGAKLGERWHTKLATRVNDPSVGPAADARRLADREDVARDEHLDRDDIVGRQVIDLDRPRTHDDEHGPDVGAPASAPRSDPAAR